MIVAHPKSRKKSLRVNSSPLRANRSPQKVRTSKEKTSKGNKENPMLRWPLPLQVIMRTAQRQRTQAQGQRTVNKVLPLQSQTQVLRLFAPFAKAHIRLPNVPPQCQPCRCYSVCVKQTLETTAWRLVIRLRIVGAITSARNVQVPQTRANATIRNVTSDRWRVRSRNLTQILHHSLFSQPIFLLL